MCVASGRRPPIRLWPIRSKRDCDEMLIIDGFPTSRQLVSFRVGSEEKEGGGGGGQEEEEKEKARG